MSSSPCIYIGRAPVDKKGKNFASAILDHTNHQRAIFAIASWRVLEACAVLQHSANDLTLGWDRIAA